MIELGLTLRAAIQCSFMFHKWTISHSHSNTYCIDHKNGNSEVECKAIAVEGAIWPKLEPDGQDWLVQPCKPEEYHLNI